MGELTEVEGYECRSGGPRAEGIGSELGDDDVGTVNEGLLETPDVEGVGWEGELTNAGEGKALGFKVWEYVKLGYLVLRLKLGNKLAFRSQLGLLDVNGGGEARRRLVRGLGLT